MNKAVFLDRDGVINREKSYLYKIEDFEVIEGVFEAVKAFKVHHFLVLVITNQSGIGRGYYTLNDFYCLNEWMLTKFKKQRTPLDDVSYCPHVPDDHCECRKPQPGMILDLSQKYNIDLTESWLVGDKEIDVQTGVNAGIHRNILVRSGHPIDETHTKALFIRDSLYQCINVILGNDK